MADPIFQSLVFCSFCGAKANDDPDLTFFASESDNKQTIYICEDCVMACASSLQEKYDNEGSA